MTITKNILISLSAMLLLTVVLSGCSDHEIIDSSEQPVRTDSIYINLEMTSPTNTTRANPSGGEDGDDYPEGGVNKENDIKKVVLCFYQAANGINSRDEDVKLTKIPVSSVIVTGSDKLYTASFSVPSSTLTLGAEYHLVVVANPTNEVSGITKLKDLKDAVLNTAWTHNGDIAKCDNFVMSSRFLASGAAEEEEIKGEKGYKDITYILTNSNTQNNPLKIEAVIERVAARIDIIPATLTNGAKWDETNNGYEFPVTGAPDDKLIVTDVMPVNCMKQGSYLMKHLAAADATDKKIDYNAISLIGKEEPRSGVQTNYVVDPYTRDKTSLSSSSSPIDGTYYTNYYNNGMSVTGCPIQKPTIDDHYILAYTMENTMDLDCQLAKYATGIVVKGIYVPKKWYNVVDGKLKEEEATAKETFYTFSGHVFASRDAADKYKQDTEDGAATGTVSTYTDGVCYYVYWLRHSNDNKPEEKGIMEYGVVRNNIYRLSLNKFSGIGDPIPGGDEDVEKMNCNVYVVPWAVYNHDKIIF